MRRVNASVKEVVADALPDLKDPRIGLVTVTGVQTSPDLSHATVYVSVLGSQKKRDKTMRGLAAAHGAVQAHLAKELSLKRTPTLEFVFDPTVARGMEMTKLIDALVVSEPEEGDQVAE